MLFDGPILGVTMPVVIRLISLSNTELKIEPQRIGFKSPFADLSTELNQLKRQLFTHGLCEGIDYTQYSGPSPSTCHEYKLQFTGKSLVLRALYAIPIDWIEFSETTKLSGWGIDITKPDFEMMRMSYATSIHSRECFVSEVPWVKTAYQRSFEELIGAINQVHRQFSKNSPVIEQLKREMTALIQKPDELFESANFHLLLCCLYKAMKKEEADPTVFEKQLVTFNKKSKLLPHYEDLIKNYASRSPQIFHKEASTTGYGPNEPLYRETYAKVQSTAINGTLNQLSPVYSN